MAKNEKRVSVNAFERVMKNNFANTQTIQWYDIEVVVKRSLSVTEMLAFVNNVVESVFDSDGNYTPEAMDFAVRLNILTRYANFTMPKDVLKQYEFVYGTDAVDAVTEFINMTQLKEITAAIKRKVDYACSINVSTVQRELMKLVTSFSELQANTEKIFDGVSNDDLNRLVSALAEHGELDEKKIVDAVLEKRSADDTADGE